MHTSEACLQPSKIFVMELKAVKYFPKNFQIFFCFYHKRVSGYLFLRRLLTVYRICLFFVIEKLPSFLNSTV